MRIGLAEKYAIIYLTGRHEHGQHESAHQLSATFQSLKSYGFPEPDNSTVVLCMKPMTQGFTTIEAQANEDLEFKREFLSKLTVYVRKDLEDSRSMVGVGDTASDMARYAEAGISGFLLKRPHFRLQTLVESFDQANIYGNWDDLKNQLRSLL